MHTKRWTRAYKLTEQNGTTHYGACQWGIGVTNPHGVKDGAHGLCSASFYHCYDSPEVAAFMNPIHANISNPRGWWVEVRGVVVNDSGFKRGATEMRVVGKAPVIAITTEQRIAAAIYIAGSAMAAAGVAMSVWGAWAEGWLDGSDRSEATAAAAEKAAGWATWTAGWAARTEAAQAARAAAAVEAARAARLAARTARAARLARLAARTARAAAEDVSDLLHDAIAFAQVMYPAEGA